MVPYSLTDSPWRLNLINRRLLLESCYILDRMKKNTKIWIILLAAPLPLLLFIALLQVVVRAALTGETGEPNAIATVFSVIFLLIGTASALCLFAAPIWIILLVSAIHYNNKLEATSEPPVASPQAPASPEETTPPSP
jgi:hypothetical protein